MILLSIIIPHYNSTQQLKILLETIPQREDVEVIIIDDNSELDTGCYCKLKKTYSNYIFLQNNCATKSAGACRNIGLKTAKGEWVLFADADDYFIEGFYNKLAKYFFTDNDVVFFTPTSIDIFCGEISDRHLFYNKLVKNYLRYHDEDAVLQLRYKFAVPWSKLIKRKLLQDHEIFFDEIVASNDVMFSVKVGHCMGEFSASEEVVYCVTKGIGTLTKNNSEYIFNARVQAHIDYCSFLRKNLTKKQLKKIDRSGRELIKQAINYQLGIKKGLETLLLLLRNRVPILSLRYFNILIIFNQLKTHKKNYQKNSIYYKKKAK